MQENRVSIKVAPADAQKIADATKIIQDTLMPYLVALTPEDRQNLPKIKQANLPFVQKALEHASSNPNFVPTYIDVNELKIDVNAVDMLNSLLHPLQQVTSSLDDTTMLCGSEAYIAALAFYNSVKQAAKMNVPGAKPIYEDLKVRFAQQGRRKAAPEQAS